MKVVVLGAGESGIGVALLADKKHFEVFVSDAGEIEERFKNELIEKNIPFEEKGHTIDRLKKTDILVKSPGIPDHIPLIQELKSAGLDPISEIEFASRFYEGKIVAITGTNGKTTTTGLVYHLLAQTFDRIEIGGNYGKSFARILFESEPEIVVLEISSFQLDGIRTFHPDVAILLNITPDHLDRYSYNMDQYADSKMLIWKNHRENDVFIYNGEEPYILNRIPVEEVKTELYISVQWNASNTLLSKESGKQYKLTNDFLKGPHNQFNAQCAVYAAESMGVSSSRIQEGLDSFENLPHRMEPVLTWHGVQYINDSKATNVDATRFALEAMSQDTIWIVGGTDKGNEYDDLLSLVQEKVKAILCLGIDNEKLVKTFGGSQIQLEEFRDMKSCVTRAHEIAQSGDVVLLSPACASFDLFKNYIDRGNQFKEAVLALAKK